MIKKTSVYSNFFWRAKLQELRKEFKNKELIAFIVNSENKKMSTEILASWDFLKRDRSKLELTSKTVLFFYGELKRKIQYPTGDE